jgi:GNAT superfamily N-acetyltransferase
VQIHSTDSLSSEKESGATGRMSKWRGKTIERLAKVFGRKRVVFFSSSSPAGTTTNGMTYGADGVLYINIDAGVDPLAVVGHEWRHTLRYSNAAAHAAINQAATKLLDQPGRLLEFAKVYHGVELAQEDGGSKETKDLIARIEAGEATAREKARLAEEFSADMTGNLWRDPKALKEVFDTILEQHPPSAARTIIKSIGDAIIKLINKLIISTPKGQYSEMGISREELLGLKKEIQAAMADSFRQDVQQRMGKARGVNRSAPRENDTPIGKAKEIEVDGVMRQTTNSLGKTIHPTEEGVRNFWRWFGESKAVDADGRPLVFYHGGKGGITSFEDGATTRDSAYKKNSLHSQGIWLTANSGGVVGKILKGFQFSENFMSSEAATYASGLDDGYVYALYAKIENPENMSQRDAGFTSAGKIKGEGKDGAYTVDSGFWVALSGNQVKSAIGNSGQFDAKNPDIRFSPPRFFSQLATSIDKIPKKMETMPAAQWRMWLTGNAPKLGIKKDEIVWSGIEDYLEMRGKDKVTKAEVQQFLSENGTQVSDVVLGEVDTGDVESWWGDEGGANEETPFDELSDAEQKDAIQRYREEVQAYEEEGTGTKFGQYVVPGGENYRELLITLPGGESLKDATERRDAAWTRISERIDFPSDAHPLRQTAWAQENVPKLYAEWQDASRVANGKKTDGDANTFRSSHFDQPNILVHLRMDERTDAQGAKILFLEELQSDWHQSGQKKGYRLSDAEFKKLNDRRLELEYLGREAMYSGEEMPSSMKQEWADIMNRTGGLDGQASRVPDAPFKDTKSWVALGLKRAIMYAVQNGMNKVAWANGEQNAAHYDLSKQVEEIEATPNGDGTYDLVMTLLDGGTQRMNNVAEGKLDDSIGKELAEKIVNDSARWTAANKAYRDELKKTYIPEERLDELRDARDEIELTYSGLDLKVGGEGMRAFYDQIVPQVANDVLKKLGGGKVETIEIDTRSPEDNSYYETPKDSDFMPQQGFTIPQIMVEKVQTEGVPLFSPPRYEVKRDEEDEGTFAVALSNDQKNRNGDPLQVAHLHVPDEAVSAAGWRIGDIQVTKALRRQGIASELVRRMSKHLGSKPIGAASVFSEDGKKFFENAKFSPARAQTETPEFKKWFGDSKVVDAEGKPLVVYHGTVGDHNVFDESTRGQYTREDQGAQSGFFFTASRSMAEWFAERAYERRGTRDSEGNERPYDARVIEVYLKAENPYIPTDEEGNYKSIRHAESNGHDSVYLPDGDDVNPEETWIVLSNKQIKSATGNNGQFDPTNPDIRRSTPRGAITNQPINQSWQDPDNMGKWDDFVRTMADKMWDTKKVLAAIRAAGIAIKDTIDPYLQEVLYHGRAAKRVSDFADNELRPMLVEMGARKIERQELEDYLWARHATERNAQIAKINPKMPDGGSGLTNQQAADILSGQTVNIGGRDIKLNLAQMPGYRSLAAKIDAITKETTDTLVRYGLETQDTVDAWRNTYGKYVPLMRDMEADDNYAGAFNLGLGTGQGFSVRGSASKRALGSERGVIDILANVAMQRERAIVRGEKNRVAQSMYGLAITAPNPDFWLPLNPDAKKDPAQVTAELVALGLNPIDAANIANEPKQRYTDPNTGMVMERISPQLRSRGDVLAVRINGKDRYVMFSSNERAQKMVAGLKNLDVDQLGMVMQKMAVVTRWFAAINTQYNPVFGLTNGIRDLGTGMLNLTSTELKGHQAEVFKNAFSALRGVYADLRDHRAGRAPTSKWALEFEEFALEGGQTGYRDMFQTSRDRTEGLMQELKDATKGKTLLTFSEKRSPLFGWLSDYNTSIENAIRLSAYKAAKDKGMTKAQAASLAKNLTVNFNKKGLAATQLGAMYAFFNAAAQGTARIGQTLVKVDNGKFSLTGAGKKIVYGGMMAGVLQAAMFAAAGWDDEEPPQFIREKNFIIPVPVGTPGASEHKGKDGKVRYYLSVPYPLGYHVLPGVGRISTEFALGGFKNPGKRLVDMFSMIMDGFNPIGGSSGGVSQMLSPTVTDPLVALSENKDWTGKSIYKEDFNSMHPTAGWTRKKDTASNLSRWLAYGINYLTGGGKYEIGLLSPTPDQLDYLIGQATGGVGRESLKAWQFGATAATGENMPMYKVPIAGRFVGETTGQASETSKFYNNLKRIGEHKAALDEMQKARDLSAMIEYRKENPDAALVKQADKASTDISELKRRKRELLEKGSSPEQIKLMEAVITTRVKRYNEMLSARS